MSNLVFGCRSWGGVSGEGSVGGLGGFEGFLGAEVRGHGAPSQALSAAGTVRLLGHRAYDLRSKGRPEIKRHVHGHAERVSLTA